MFDHVVNFLLSVALVFFMFYRRFGAYLSHYHRRSVTTSTNSGFTAVTGASQYLIMPKHMSKELAEPMNINWKTSSIHRFENG